MKVLIQTGYGSLSQNIKIQEVEKPKISDGEVLIKVHYASLNPHDCKSCFRRI